MLINLWHFLFGHKYSLYDTVYHPAIKRATGVSVTLENERREIYGFTDITSFCACGKKKVHRLTGRHRTLAPDNELVKLREMAGL
jgi:hypothetical protein